METNSHRPKSSEKATIPLNLTAEEAAFLDSACQAMGISREAYFEMLIESDLEGSVTREPSEGKGGISERIRILTLLTSEGWSVTSKPCRIELRPGWLLQARRDKESHQVLTDELTGGYLRLLASTRHM